MALFERQAKDSGARDPLDLIGHAGHPRLGFRRPPDGFLGSHIEPRHFEALSTLGIMFEQMDEPELALRAFEKVQELSPNRPSAKDAVTRLRRLSGDVEL